MPLLEWNGICIPERSRPSQIDSDLIQQYRRISGIMPSSFEYDYDLNPLAGIKHQLDCAFSRIRTTEEDQSPLDDDRPVLAMDEQENSGQSIYVMNTFEDAEIPLRMTTKQPFDASLTEKELVYELKLKQYC